MNLYSYLLDVWFTNRMIKYSKGLFCFWNSLCLYKCVILVSWILVGGSKGAVLNLGLEQPFHRSRLRPSEHRYLQWWSITLAALQAWSSSENNFMVGWVTMRTVVKGHCIRKAKNYCSKARKASVFTALTESGVLLAKCALHSLAHSLPGLSIPISQTWRLKSENNWKALGKRGFTSTERESSLLNNWSIFLKRKEIIYRETDCDLFHIPQKKGCIQLKHCHIWGWPDLVC